MGPVNGTLYGVELALQRDPGRWFSRVNRSA